MFTLGNGFAEDNAWNMPDGYTDKFLRLLPVFELRVVTVAANWIIVEPTRYGHPRYMKWFHITDNGGEVTVGEINSDQLMVAIPYKTTKTGVVNPATVVARIEQAIKGTPIDWEFSFSAEAESTLLQVVPTLR